MHTIKEWMDKFQRGYIEKVNLEKFINETITLDKNTIFLGTDLKNWCNNLESIQSLIQKQWQFDYDFNFSESIVETHGPNTFIYSTATIRVVDHMFPLLSKEDVVYEEVDYLIKEICEKLANHAYKRIPVRFTAILDETFKAHHIQFSYDAMILWQYRFLEEDKLKLTIDMPARSDAKEIRDLLGHFQSGYLKRDLNEVDAFMQLFTENQKAVYIGTDAEEFLQGPDALKEIIESDWEYWGDFKIDLDGAVIVEKNDFAYFTTQAYIFKKHNHESMMKGISYYYNEAIKENTASSLIEGLRYMTHLKYEMDKGEDFFAPMRFSGFCIKENGEWKFGHIQYSDYMHTPEKYID
ncbi:MAG: nuclear transport factor 2 family protein [Clostridia bacterium]|nr:nuclear transport factor 2 family protein [Clostridia bacterium]